MLSQKDWEWTVTVSSLGWLYLAATASQAPSAAAWSRIDIGMGIPSGPILCILIGAFLAMAISDKEHNAKALFGMFVTSTIGTITFMVLVGRLAVTDVPAQSAMGLGMSFFFQYWGVNWAKRFLRAFTSGNSGNGDRTNE